MICPSCNKQNKVGFNDWSRSWSLGWTITCTRCRSKLKIGPRATALVWFFGIIFAILIGIFKPSTGSWLSIGLHTLPCLIIFFVIILFVYKNSDYVATESRKK